MGQAGLRLALLFVCAALAALLAVTHPPVKDQEIIDCNCEVGNPVDCGYYTFENCMTRPNPDPCETDCCKECDEECRVNCLERSLTCGWSTYQTYDCLSGCLRAESCWACLGPPPPDCP